MKAFFKFCRNILEVLLFLYNKNYMIQMPILSDWQYMSPILPRGYVCYRAEQPLILNGKMDDAQWQRAAWSDLFVDIEGTNKPLPYYTTQFKMLWDENYLYIGAKLEEPHIWGKLTQKNSVIFHDNDFEVFIDPDGDNHNYYEFEVNVLNTIWELTLPRPYKDGGQAISPTNLDGLISAIHVEGSVNDPSDTDAYWSVEMAFPFKELARYCGELPCPPQDGDQWRINFSRVQWQHQIENGKYEKVPNTPEHNWVWSPQGIIDMHRPERWGYVQFSTAEAQSTRFIPDPTHEARNTLLLIYHSQKGYANTYQQWALSFGELGLGDLAHHPLKPQLNPTLHGFQASILLEDGRRICINEFSKIWIE